MCLALMGIGVVPASAQVARDSAGVAVRMYTVETKPGQQWQLERTPVLVIGGPGSTGREEFAGIRGVARLDNGAVVVADAGSMELRLFNEKGEFVRAFGRRGSGPGEFEGIGQVTRAGDTLIVSDFQDRLHLWRPDGTLLKTLARAPVGTLPNPKWMGRLTGGRDVFVGTPAMFQPWNGTTTVEAPIVLRTSPTTTTAIATIPVFEVANVGGRQMPVYLGPAARLAIGERNICAAWTKMWQVTCFDDAGKPRWRTSRATTPAPLAEADKEAFRESFRRANRHNGPPERVEAIVRSFAFGMERPPISRIELSRVGDVWVGPYVLQEETQLGQVGLPVPDRGTTWSVLDRNGAWRADIDLPPRFRLVEAGSDYVAGVLRDADDVESVVVYRIRR